MLNAWSHTRNTYLNARNVSVDIGISEFKMPK